MSKHASVIQYQPQSITIICKQLKTNKQHTNKTFMYCTVESQDRLDLKLCLHAVTVVRRLLLHYGFMAQISHRYTHTPVLYSLTAVFIIFKHQIIHIFLLLYSPTATIPKKEFPTITATTIMYNGNGDIRQ